MFKKTSIALLITMAFSAPVAFAQTTTAVGTNAVASGQDSTAIGYGYPFSVIDFPA